MSARNNLLPSGHRDDDAVLRAIASVLARGRALASGNTSSSASNDSVDVLYEIATGQNLGLGYAITCAVLVRARAARRARDATRRGGYASPRDAPRSRRRRRRVWRRPSAPLVYGGAGAPARGPAAIAAAARLPPARPA